MATNKDTKSELGLTDDHIKTLIAYMKHAGKPDMDAFAMELGINKAHANKKLSRLREKLGKASPSTPTGEQDKDPMESSAPATPKSGKRKSVSEAPTPRPPKSPKTTKKAAPKKQQANKNGDGDVEMDGGGESTEKSTKSPSSEKGQVKQEEEESEAE